MTTRPLIQVRGADGAASVAIPEVLAAPIRTDIVNFVHTNMAKNDRTPYARFRHAGEQTSAISWGTGRAVSRIPRVGGSGTHRSGQGAFGNMCRKGRMFAPLKAWRRWHRPINVNQRRFAVCSALAATAVAPLVIARGHAVMQVPEVPLVVADKAVEGITKTSEAVALLEKLGCADDLSRVKNSRTMRAGRGKSRNRRFVQRLGPLLVHSDKSGKDSTLVKAFRNIQGVDCASVYALNLLELAPGGHVGRFVIWTESAFNALDKVFGNSTTDSAEKSGYRPPTSIVSNPDLGAVVNSTEIQSVLRAKKGGRKSIGKKQNPLKNVHALKKLNPYAITMRRRALKAQEASKSARDAKVASKRKGCQAKKYAAILLE